MMGMCPIRRHGAQGVCSPTRRGPRLRQLLLPLGGALLFVLACGAPQTLLHAPASSIRLTILVFNQFAPAAPVRLEAGFAVGPQIFALSGNQSFSCQGVLLAPLDRFDPGVSAQLPRQPPGGAYRCVYTDEQGQHTSVTVPVSPGRLFVTSPMPGATVPLPAVAQPPGSPTPTTVPRPPELTSSLLIQYQFPSVPQEATAQVAVSAKCSPRGVVGGRDEPATGSYRLSDAYLPYGNGFEICTAGPGALILSSMIQWAPSPGGFVAVHLIYQDHPTFPITWTRGAGS